MIKNACVFGVLGIIASGPVPGAVAADYTSPLPPTRGSASRWAGLYAGVHFGYGWGGFGAGTNPHLNQGVLLPATVTGLIGGYQIGYNFLFPNNVVLGLEADVSFLSPIDQKATETAAFNTTLNYFATAKSRIGYAFGDFLPYVTGGAAWGQSKIEMRTAPSHPLDR